MESAYRAAGKPELYDPNKVLYWGESNSGPELMLIAEVKPGASFRLGAASMSSVVMASHQMTLGLDVFQMTGQRNIYRQAQSVLGPDDFLLSDEIFAVAAYVSQRKEAVGTILAGDWMKFIGLAILFVGLLLTAAGSSNMILDFLGM
jgi:hypothetical protein